jgi:hypothetical protein
LVMNLGFTDTALRWNSNHRSGRFQLHCDSRKHGRFKPMSNECWFVFLTLKASCIRNLFHQDRLWMETSVVMFWSSWGKTFNASIQPVAQQFLISAPWQCSHPHVTHFAAAFWFNTSNSHSLTRPHPISCFPISKNAIGA